MSAIVPTVEALPEKLRSKIRVQPETGCWMWTAGLTREGYGQIWWQGRNRWGAHRIVWSYFYGPWPKGLVADHFCHDATVCLGGKNDPCRRCVNPQHILVTTQSVNASARRNSRFCHPSTHCPQGHEYTSENTYQTPEGRRGCRICKAAGNQRYRERNRETLRERSSEYYQRHLEAQRARSRAKMQRYREENRDALNERRRELRKANREAYNAQERERCAQNREAYNARKRHERRARREALSRQLELREPDSGQQQSGDAA